MWIHYPYIALGNCNDRYCTVLWYTALDIVMGWVGLNWIGLGCIVLHYTVTYGITLCCNVLWRNILYRNVRDCLALCYAAPSCTIMIHQIHLTRSSNTRITLKIYTFMPRLTTFIFVFWAHLLLVCKIDEWVGTFLFSFLFFSSLLFYSLLLLLLLLSSLHFTFSSFLLLSSLPFFSILLFTSLHFFCLFFSSLLF